jgi:3-hydroxyisobutyrate dehydrogenase
VVNDELVNVGWVGTGVMGSPMCGHLLAAGYPVKVFSRTKERASSLVEQGAQWCASPAEASEGSDVVVSLVGYPSDVRQVVLGDEGVLTTSLVIMVGGSQETFDRALPLLQRLGKVVTLQGGAGAGQHTKMVNQIAIASGMVGVCEALLYAYRAGLDVAKVLDTIGPGAAGSWSLTNYGPRALRGDFEPGFKVDHFIKDLGIALGEARRMKLSLPGLALAEQLYVAAGAQGRGQKGTHALVLALAHLSNIDWPAAGS